MQRRRNIQEYTESGSDMDIDQDEEGSEQESDNGDQDQDQEHNGDGEDDQGEDGDQDQSSSETIPCEMCGQNINFDIYADHIDICIRHSSYQAVVQSDRLRTAMANGGMRIRLNPQRTADDIMALNLLTQYMGMTLSQGRNEYEYNLWLQDAMGGNVNIGIRDKEAVTTRVEVEAVPADTMCTICLEPPNTPRKTTCDHYFCEECIFKWLSENRKCPNCTIQLGV